MSKKMRRHMSSREPTALSGKNCHHILYTKRIWGSGYARALREFWYCKITMDVNEHNAIHRKVHFVPIPKGINARLTLEQLKMLDKSGALHETDDLRKRINLIACLFDCIEQKTADALRRQL